MAAAHIEPREAEAEIRAQVERALQSGIRPTHLVSHMGTLYQRPELLAVLLRVAREYRLPVRLARERLAEPAFAAVPPGEVLIDHMIGADPDVAPTRWRDSSTPTRSGVPRRG